MMNLTLLAAQTAIGDTLAGGNPVLTPVSGEAQMNLWDMALKGGWIMAVLAVLSVVCFYIFFERLAVIRKAGKDDPMFMERIRDYIRTGEIKSAINYCRITNTPSARMIEKRELPVWGVLWPMCRLLLKIQVILKLPNWKTDCLLLQPFPAVHL